MKRKTIEEKKRTEDMTELLYICLFLEMYLLKTFNT